MGERLIYTAGAMKGSTLTEQMSWRFALEIAVKNHANGKSFTFIHPPLYYNYEETSHQTEREIMEYELNALRRCDILVVNLADVHKSIGTHMELGFVNAVNAFGNRHIFVIGIGDDTPAHPWIEASLFRKERTVEEAAAFISYYF